MTTRIEEMKEHVDWLSAFVAGVMAHYPHDEVSNAEIHMMKLNRLIEEQRKEE